MLFIDFDLEYELVLLENGLRLFVDAEEDDEYGEFSLLKLVDSNEEDPFLNGLLLLGLGGVLALVLIVVVRLLMSELTFVLAPNL